MKTTIYSLSLVVLTISMMACKGKKKTITHSHEFDQDVTIGVGDTATFDDGLSFSLVRITSDSRCPKGAECIWAGEVVAVFTANDEEELTISSDPLKNPVKLGTYLIELIGASPEKTEATIAQGDYRLTFKIRKPIEQP
jgi:hypothetical protein